MSNPFTNPFGSSSGNSQRRRRASSTQENQFADLPGPDYFTGGSPGGSGSRPPPARRQRRDSNRGPPMSYNNAHNQPELRRSSSSSNSRYTPISYGGPSNSLYESQPDPYSMARRPSSSVRRPSAAEIVSTPPLRRRRGAQDLSAQAFDPYDPFANGLRRPSGYRRESDGDVDLPVYRSASAYARNPGGYPPTYYSGRAGSQDVLPPRYTSVGSSQGYGGPPMQYPATRRPSAYDQSGMSSNLDYEAEKRERRR